MVFLYHCAAMSIECRNVVYNAGAMNLSTSRRLLLATVSGCLLALAYPPFDFRLAGWIAPAVLIVAVLGQKPGSAFFLGGLQGVMYYALSLPWIYNVMRQYGPLPVLQAAGVFALVVVVASLFHAFFAAVVAWIGERAPERACLAAPFVWVAMEFALMHLPAIGFPWNLLGYVAAGNLALVQLTAVTGIFGLSLLVAFFNGLCAWAVLQFVKGSNTSLPWPAGMGVALAVIALAGPRFVPRPGGDHVAHLVQTNFPVALNYPSNWMQIHAGEMDQLEKLSISAAQKSPGLVVWPEVPAPFSLQDPNFHARAVRIARGARNGFLVGVLDFKPLGNGQSAPTNSAALLGPDGALDFIYDKIHLVPFSEYVPWREWLFFARDLTGIIGDFQRGSQYKVGRIAGGSFSVYICYEAIFPNEVRRFTVAGAQLFINISDDGWFGASGAPEQHLAMARVRAVENRRWLLRDTNTGITVSVDPYGRIVARLAPDVRGELDAPYAFRSDLTPYARWGDWIAWLCVLAVLVLVLDRARLALQNKHA
jgi:apolipoprotein N-acyltransferase